MNLSRRDLLRLGTSSLLACGSGVPLFLVRTATAVAAEPAATWRAAVNWPRQCEWIWATRVSGGHGTGAKVSGRTGIGPIGFTDPMVITEWDPPRRCVLRHTGRLEVEFR